MKRLILLPVLLPGLVTAFMNSAAAEWPGGAPAAVSLSYDNGPPNHLDVVIPQLEKHHFRATFYINSHRQETQNRVRDWKKAHEAGHEIGDHLAIHYCHHGDNSGFRGFPADLSGFSSRQIRELMAISYEWLNKHIGRDPYRTFAYPCGETGIGKDAKDHRSYAGAIATYYTAARTISGGVMGKPFKKNFAPYLLPATTSLNLSDLKQAVDRAVRTGGWVNIYLHQVKNNPRGSEFDSQDHKNLLRHLEKSRVWVAPVGHVFDYIAGR